MANRASSFGYGAGAYTPSAYYSTTPMPTTAPGFASDDVAGLRKAVADHVLSQDTRNKSTDGQLVAFRASLSAMERELKGVTSYVTLPPAGSPPFNLVNTAVDVATFGAKLQAMEHKLATIPDVATLQAKIEALEQKLGAMAGGQDRPMMMDDSEERLGCRLSALEEAFDENTIKFSDFERVTSTLKSSINDLKGDAKEKAVKLSVLESKLLSQQTPKPALPAFSAVSAVPAAPAAPAATAAPAPANLAIPTISVVPAITAHLALRPAPTAPTTPAHPTRQPSSSTYRMQESRQTSLGTSLAYKFGDARGRRNSDASASSNISGSIAKGAVGDKRKRDSLHGSPSPMSLRIPPPPKKKPTDTKPADRMPAARTPAQRNPTSKAMGSGIAGVSSNDAGVLSNIGGVLNNVVDIRSDVAGPSGNNGPCEIIAVHKVVPNLLRSLDCTSVKEMRRLKSYVDGTVAHELQLFQLRTRDGLLNDFYVKIGGRLRRSLRAGEREHTDMDIKRQIPDHLNHMIAMNILECYLAGKDETDDEIPQFFIPLGEVFMLERSRGTGADLVKSTNWFLVMDITTPAKGIWMVYRYEHYPESSFAPGGINRKPRTISFVQPATHHQSSIFTHHKVFDLVCLLKDIKMWKFSDRWMMDTGDAEKALCSRNGGKDSVVLKPLFARPLFKEVKSLLEENWERYWTADDEPVFPF
ncbi:hypothetical protein B0H67DRAFT_555885 [Lasiosphaeris hirsuta]|uniref:Uncharacterized protein n=1 Tax=Lasiosphaeris hirsuta TaxID=260670 RepID=A0AA40A9Z0_9PEZI|nr:hypothetical protein B0H67DRAFT_555885 [Lasiosphaeris hirsuta]